MVSITRQSPPSRQTGTLLADYSRWLTFLETARQTMRGYDRQLAQVAEQHPDLSPLSEYLRHCMHQRNLFFGELAILLTGRVAQLRAEPANETLVGKLTRAYPVVQAQMGQMAEAFTQIEQSYRTLFRPFPNR